MTEASKRRATLSDVAAAAGVSKATVSKTLNGRDDVAAHTRELVLEAATKLGYRASTAAGQSPRRAIAVTFDIPASPYILSLLQGVLAAATEQGLDLVTRLPPARDVRPQRSAARDWIAEQQSIGAIGIIGLTVSRPDALLDAAAEVDLPFVIVDPVGTTHPHLISVASSNWAGARAATEHLIGLGHRRIAWIGGPDESKAARDRLYGYGAAMDAAGLAADPALVASDLFDVATGTRHARRMLGETTRPTAIMAADDEIAIGVLVAARELGLRVPEDLSVVGFDDTPQAPWTTPPLTTVRQHLEEMGSMAVRTVAAIDSGQPEVSRHVELATSLTVRESTAPPAE